MRNGQPVTTKLSDKTLSCDSRVMLSSAAVNKADINRELCTPHTFISMPSIAYRLAKVAAGDGVCGVSLCPVSAHDVVAGHALLRGGGVRLNENGESIRYVTEDNIRAVSRRCFGGLEIVCQTLVARGLGPHFSRLTRTQFPGPQGDLWSYYPSGHRSGIHPTNHWPPRCRC